MIYVVALVIAALYSWALAETKPFTIPADALVAVGFLLIGAPLAAGLRRWRKGTREGAARTRRAARVDLWVAVIAATALLELAAYFAGWGAGRHAFPTLSSLYDEAAGSSVAVKAVLVFLWMAMGWGLFRPRRAPAEPS